MKRASFLRSFGVVLAVSLGQAAFGVVMNPDGFQTYAPTTPGANLALHWYPTQVNDGWSPNSSGSNIVTGTGTNTTKVLHQEDFDAGSNVSINWHPNVDPVTIPLQTAKFDIKLVDGGLNNFLRGQWEYGTYMQIYESGISHFGSNFIPNNFSPNAVPGGGLTLGSWYTVEVELNFTTNRSRVRFGPMGGTPGAFGPSLLLNSQSTMVTPQTNGEIQWDNFSLAGPIPEPTSLALVGLGIAMVLPRRRIRS